MALKQLTLSNNQNMEKNESLVEYFSEKSFIWFGQWLFLSNEKNLISDFCESFIKSLKRIYPNYFSHRFHCALLKISISMCTAEFTNFRFQIAWLGNQQLIFNSWYYRRALHAHLKYISWRYFTLTDAWLKKNKDNLEAIVILHNNLHPPPGKCQPSQDQIKYF